MKCYMCGEELKSTGDINGLCIECQNKTFREKQTAQYRTYENGFSDGYKKALDDLKPIYEELNKKLALHTPTYMVVTQEKYDEILKEMKKE